MQRQAGQPDHNVNLYVQGARGLLSMFVFVYHVIRSEVPTFDFVHSGPFAAGLHTLEYGVDLFFCISGFVIMGSLHRAPNAGVFLVDRAVRIYPVLWPAIAVSLTWGLLFRHRDFALHSVETVLWSIPANLLALPGFINMFLIHPVAWSLSYEVVFYTFCGIAWYLIGRMGWRRAAVLWVPVAVVLLVHYPRGLFFVSGVLVAGGLVRRFALTRFLACYPIIMLVTMLATWGGIQAVTGSTHMVWTTMIDWAGDGRLPLAGVAVVAATLFMQGVVNGTGPLGWLLRRWPLVALGTISYSFYLWHVPGIALSRRLLVTLGLDQMAGQGSQVVLAAIALPLSLALAYGSWFVLETGFCPWLRRRVIGARPRAEAVAPAI